MNVSKHNTRGEDRFRCFTPFKTKAKTKSLIRDFFERAHSRTILFLFIVPASVLTCVHFSTPNFAVRSVFVYQNLQLVQEVPTLLTIFNFLYQRNLIIEIQILKTFLFFKNVAVL